MKAAIIILLLCSIHSFVKAQKADPLIQKGNDLYKQKQYQAAAAAYDQALQKDPSSVAAKYNRASAAYRLSQTNEAIRAFDELETNTREPKEKAKLYYNKGVVLSSQKKLEESIEAYKNALRQDPDDKDARENLQKALLELKKKNPPPKKEDEKKKKQQQQQNQKDQDQPKMNPREADQKLKLLGQKEKELQQRMQRQKAKTGGSSKRDW